MIFVYLVYILQYNLEQSHEIHFVQRSKSFAERPVNSLKFAGIDVEFFLEDLAEMGDVLEASAVSCF